MGRTIIKGAALILAIGMIFAIIGAKSEEYSTEPNAANKLIVIVDTLNGRFRPNKKSPVLAEYAFLDELTPTGKWSRDKQWVEIFHPEEGTVWVNINYVSERTDVFEVYTLNDQPIKVRSRPEIGKVKKYLHKDEHVEITQVVMGYGRCQWGWLDLGYFIEEPKE